LNIGTVNEPNTEAFRDLALLDEIEKDPDVNQADLATQLGVAVGTVNWHLKRLIAKGAIKVSRATRRKLRYLITPEGLAIRAGLTMDFIQQSFKLYRVLRTRTAELIPLIQEAGFDSVRLMAEGDAHDVIRLTLLEAGIKVAEDGDLPVISMTGLKLTLDLPAEEKA
jgi:DNA-binding MarR family transcriptional regulator